MVSRIYKKTLIINSIQRNLEKKNPKAYREKESIHSQKYFANHALTQTYSIINTIHNNQ